jgi:transketolase C-terminal domain/subunit
MKTWQLLVLAAVLLGAGIAGDVIIQGTKSSSDVVTFSHVDLAHDTATLEFHETVPDRLLGVARKQHLALIAGALAAWGPLAAAWRRRRKA